MNAERWLPIPGATGYEASDLGRIRSSRPCRNLPVPRVLASKKNMGGYVVFRIRLDDGRYVYKSAHRLVMEAHVGPMPDGMVTRHLNGVRSDNRLTNLAYGTSSQNARDTITHGNNPWSNRTHCGKGHPLSGDNVRPRTDHGGRVCVTCERAKWKRYNDRRAQKARAS